MSLDTTELEDDVLAKIRDIFPKTVYEDNIPEDDSLEYDGRGNLIPFAIYQGGDLTRSTTDRSLVSVRQDSYKFFFTISVFTGRSKDTKRLMGRLVDGLTGYRPTNGGELTPKGTLRWSRSSVANRPTQYIREYTFECLTNLRWEL